MNIEKLKYEDLSSYKQLIDECFGESNSLDIYKEKYIENSNYEIIVVKSDDMIIGSVTFIRLDLFTFDFQPSIEIFNVAVLPDYRNKKIAKSIFNYIITTVKKEGYKSVVLTCLDNAYDAHGLYESLGFIRTSSVKYKLDI